MVHADDNAGYRNWTPIDRPQVVRYNGSRQKVIVFGAIAADGRSLFRTYDRFDQDVYQVPQGTAPPVRQDCSHHGQCTTTSCCNMSGSENAWIGIFAEIIMSGSISELSYPVHSLSYKSPGIS